MCSSLANKEKYVCGLLQIAGNKSKTVIQLLLTLLVLIEQKKMRIQRHFCGEIGLGTNIPSCIAKKIYLMAKNFVIIINNSLIFLYF